MNRRYPMPIEKLIRKTSKTGNEVEYAHDAESGHEMQHYVLSAHDFLARVQHVRDETRSLTAETERIGRLHQRALDRGDADVQRQLDQLVAATQVKNRGIRDQIRNLQADAGRTREDGSFRMKKRQVESLHEGFKIQLQGFLQAEQQYKERYREQVARQYRVVNPEAGDEEARQAADSDWGNEGVFRAALRTNRTGQASAALNAVLARHNDLRKLEQSITELARLFEDLDSLVVQQDPIFNHMEDQTEQVNVKLAKGIDQVEVAKRHAKRRRRLKWWCALVVVLILLAIAAGIAAGIKLRPSAS